MQLPEMGLCMHVDILMNFMRATLPSYSSTTEKGEFLGFFPMNISEISVSSVQFQVDS